MLSTNLISVITSIAVIGHALLGCCWHHAHAANSQQTVANSSINHYVCHHSPSDLSDALGPAGQHLPKDGDHHEHSTCDGSKCTFYPTKNSNLDFFNHAVALVPMSHDELRTVINGMGSLPVWADAQGSVQSFMRLHAQKQVWLI